MNDESTPKGAHETAKSEAHSTPNVLSPRDVSELARRRNYAVRVFAERRDGIVTQQVFAQLEAAERKAERVRARGLAVRLELVHLVPVQPLEDEAVRL